MAHAVFDVDGTVAAYPQECQALMSALMAAGHRVSILTGVSSMPVTQQDFDDKANYLRSLGMAESYDDMTVISNKVKGGLAIAKSLWLRDAGADIFVDNSTANAEEAIKYVDIVLVPWATRV